MEKINKIRDALKDNPLYQSTCRDAPELNSLNTVAEDEVTKYITCIKKLATKSCELDSRPTKLLKEIIDVLITPITEFIITGGSLSSQVKNIHN